MDSNQAKKSDFVEFGYNLDLFCTQVISKCIIMLTQQSTQLPLIFIKIKVSQTIMQFLQ